MTLTESLVPSGEMGARGADGRSPGQHAPLAPDQINGSTPMQSVTPRESTARRGRCGGEGPASWLVCRRPTVTSDLGPLSDSEAAVRAERVERFLAAARRWRSAGFTREEALAARHDGHRF